MNAVLIPPNRHEVTGSIANTEFLHAGLGRFDLFSWKTPVPTWGLERSWEIPAFQPVLHGIGGCHTKQACRLRAGEHVCLGTGQQALNQVAAACFPQGSGHVVKKGRANRAHGPILCQTVKTVSR